MSICRHYHSLIIPFFFFWSGPSLVVQGRSDHPFPPFLFSFYQILSCLVAILPVLYMPTFMASLFFLSFLHIARLTVISDKGPFFPYQFQFLNIMATTLQMIRCPDCEFSCEDAGNAMKTHRSKTHSKITTVEYTNPPEIVRLSRGPDGFFVCKRCGFAKEYPNTMQVRKNLVK